VSATEQSKSGQGLKDKLTAYIFVVSGDRDANQALRDLYDDETIRYAVRLISGGYGGFAIVEVDGVGRSSLRELQHRIQLVRDRVNPPGTDIAVAVRYGPMDPSHWKAVISGSATDPESQQSEQKPTGYKRQIGALVRIEVEPGTADQVLDALAKVKGYWASAMVAGSFDILLEIGADNIRELQRILLRISGSRGDPIPGIVKTVPAITLNPPDDTQVQSSLSSD
jgi:hypothetical protein